MQPSPSRITSNTADRFEQRKPSTSHAGATANHPASPKQLHDLEPHCSIRSLIPLPQIIEERGWTTGHYKELHTYPSRRLALLLGLADRHDGRRPWQHTHEHWRGKKTLSKQYTTRCDEVAAAEARRSEQMALLSRIRCP